MARYSKQKITSRKVLWWTKHCFYRVKHYFAKTFRFLIRKVDYLFGKFSYSKSPHFSGRSYDEFSREYGRYGEFQLWRKTRHALGKETVWFRNLYLPKDNGETLEIDLVAISPRGIFVFESKNYDGRIYGNEQHPNWLQIIRKDITHAPRKYTFFNPIMQNSMHCRHLGRILDNPALPIYSYIVFTNRCVLKNIDYNKHKAIVCRQFSVAVRIRRHKKVLEKSQIRSIKEKLEGFSLQCGKQKYEHVQNISNKYKNHFI